MNPRTFSFLVLILPSFAFAQILVNGSFEAPALSFTQDFNGAFSFQGWSGVAPSNGGSAGIVVGNGGVAPVQGNQHFAINGGNPSDRGWIEQGFSTISGASYLVSFSVGRAGGGQALSLQASVTFGGVAAASGEFVPPGGVGYAARALGFTAAGDWAVLRFVDSSGGNSISDLYLDNVGVSLTAVPEPGAWAAIVGAGALGAALVGRRLGRWS